MINLTKKISPSGIAIGLVLALMLSFSVALAQTETTAQTTIAADIPSELVPLAQDLGCQTSAECAEKFDANIEQGITLAQKYDIYTPEQERLASTFKTEVLERLRTVSQDNFEEEILALANKILSEKPALAKVMSVTRQTVNAAETIVNTVKEAGVDIRTCQKSPEDLSREQLIACVKASNNLSSKEKTVGDYIPKENAKAGEVQQMLDLENSLLAGEYPELGRIGIEQAGQICLKPGSESISDCDQIAQKFFGTEGVKQLQEARQQTTRIKEYYTQGIERMELVTPDGQKLIGKGAIRNACDKAFEENNLGLARACGNFAVKNGYATQEEIENGLKIMETFSQKAQGVKFDDCRFNPESCREFLPDDFRQQFDSQFEIFKIMSESIGFDPMRCENTYDPDIGKRCLEGAKKALSQVEEIAKNSPEARRIVEEIRGHITEGERMTEKRDEFNQDSSRGGMAGPGGCRGPEECFKYCSQPANSAECISFGAKSQIFDQNTAVQKFNIVNERFNTLPGRYPEFTEPGKDFNYMPYPNQADPRFNQYPFPYPPGQPEVDPGFNRYPYYPPQQPVGPSPECFAAISSGDFAKAKTACSSTTVNYPRPIVDPFPVCPAYAMPSPCPEGQMRQQTSDARGCPAYGACIAVENYKPIDVKPCPTETYWDGKSCVAYPKPIDVPSPCPMMPTVSSCPAGQEMYETYSAKGCGVYYGCRDTTGKMPCPSGQYWDGKSCVNQTTETYKQCDWSIDYLKMSTNTCVARSTCYITSNPDYGSMECQGVRGMTTPVPTVGSCNYSTQYWKPSTSQCLPRTNCSDTANSEYNSIECQGVRGMTTTCPSGMWWDSTTQSCKSSPVPTVGSCNYSTQYWKASTSQCQPRTNCYDTANSEYNSQECQGVRSSIVSSGCGSLTTQATCQASPGCGWANGACGGTMTTSTTCPSGQYWFTPPSGGAGYCMSSTTGGTCPAGYHSHPESGGFCMNDQENYSGTCYNSAGTSTIACPQQTYSPPGGSGCGTYASQTSCSSAPACLWQNNACIMSSTSSGSCPSGQYWYYPPGGGAGYCMSSNDTASTACAQAGGTWNTSTNYCQMPTTTTTDTTSMMTACTQAGGTWSNNACQMPTTTSNTTCPSGQYWNGSSCVSSTTSGDTTTSGGSDPSVMCAQAGGSWSGGTCVMPTSGGGGGGGGGTMPAGGCPSGQYWNGSACVATSAMILCSQIGGNWTGAACNLAENISDQKTYYSYFQKEPDSLLAQVGKAFADLFR